MNKMRVSLGSTSTGTNGRTDGTGNLAAAHGAHEPVRQHARKLRLPRLARISIGGEAIVTRERALFWFCANCQRAVPFFELANHRCSAWHVMRAGEAA